MFDRVELKLNSSDNVAVFGSGTIALNCIKMLRDRINGTIYVFEKSLGAFSDLKNKVGLIENIRYFNVSDVNVENFVCNLPIRCVFSIGNNYIFKDKIISKFLIINYHNAYLPYHPGRNNEAWTIFEGDNFSGITWHFVNKDIDAGSIICREKIPIDDTITSVKLLQEQAKLAQLAFVHILDNICEKGFLEVVKQENIERKIHYSWETPNDRILDLSWDIDKISRFLRAMDYGILHIKGFPKIEVNGNNYIVRRYKIQKDEKANERKVVIDAKEILISENKLVIKLKNLERV